MTTTDYTTTSETPATPRTLRAARELLREYGLTLSRVGPDEWCVFWSGTRNPEGYYTDSWRDAFKVGCAMRARAQMTAHGGIRVEMHRVMATAVRMDERAGVSLLDSRTKGPSVYLFDSLEVLGNVLADAAERTNLPRHSGYDQPSAWVAGCRRYLQHFTSRCLLYYNTSAGRAPERHREVLRGALADAQESLKAMAALASAASHNA